jgi:transporter family protein
MRRVRLPVRGLEWLVWSAATVLLWGVWGLLTKVAIEAVGWERTLLYGSLFNFFVIVLYLFYLRPDPGLGWGLRPAIAAGLASGMAVIFFYTALAKGKVSLVVPLTSLYPAVTVVLAALLLHEKISLTQGVGVLLALVAIFLMAL